MTKDWRVYARHILDTWAKIQRIQTRGTLDDELIYDAILRNLQTLAESTQHLPSDIKSQYPETPWRDISGFRNILVHNYLGDISSDTIAEVLHDELPKLVATVDNILKNSSVGAEQYER